MDPQNGWAKSHFLAHGLLARNYSKTYVLVSLLSLQIHSVVHSLWGGSLVWAEQNWDCFRARNCHKLWSAKWEYHFIKCFLCEPFFTIQLGKLLWPLYIFSSRTSNLKIMVLYWPQDNPSSLWVTSENISFTRFCFIQQFLVCLTLFY